MRFKKTEKFSGESFKAGLLIFLCFIVYCAVSFDMINLPIDDVYISLRYVWNFIHGNGLVFNPGEHVEGFSNPTWIFLVSLFAKIFGVSSKYELIVINRIISFVVLFPAYLFFYKTFRIYIKDKLISFLFLLLLCANYPLNSYAFAGMETPIVLLFLALFFYYFNKFITQKNRFALYLSALFLGLLSISRPEGIIYIASFVVSVIIYENRFLKLSLWHSVKKSLSFSYLSLIIFAASIIFRFSYYGELMPNTAAAKNYFTAETFIRGAQYILAGIFLGLGGFLSLLIFHINKTSYFKYRQLFILIDVIILAQSSFLLYTGWDWMASFRFVLPLLPLLFLVIFLTFDMQKKYVILIILLVLIPQTYFQRYFIRSNWSRLSGFNEVRLVSTGYKDVGEFLNKIKRPDDLMLIQEAGYVPFATGIKTFDLCGLTDKHLAAIYGPHFRVLDLNYTLSVRKPTIIVTFQTLFDSKTNLYHSEEYFQSNAVLQSEIFRQNYRNIYYKYGIGVFVLNDRNYQY